MRIGQETQRGSVLRELTAGPGQRLHLEPGIGPGAAPGANLQMERCKDGEDCGCHRAQGAVLRAEAPARARLAAEGSALSARGL